MNIFEKVKKILIEQLGVEAEEVTSETKIIVDLGADSLDVIELIMAFEEDFSIEIPDCDDDLSGKTVQDVVNYIAAATK